MNNLPSDDALTEEDTDMLADLLTQAMESPNGMDELMAMIQDVLAEEGQGVPAADAAKAEPDLASAPLSELAAHASGRFRYAPFAQVVAERLADGREQEVEAFFRDCEMTHIGWLSNLPAEQAPWLRDEATWRRFARLTIPRGVRLGRCPIPPAPTVDGEDDPHPQEEASDYHDLDVFDQLARVATVLREEGVTVAELTAAQRHELQDNEYLYICDALEQLVPERVGCFHADPFGAYTEQSMRDFYPDLWEEAARAGGWKAENLRVEMEKNDQGMVACVRFSAFGKEHEWLYWIDNHSSHADTGWPDDLYLFAAQYLEGCYMFDPDGEEIFPYAYLPRKAAKRLLRLVG